MNVSDKYLLDLCRGIVGALAHWRCERCRAFGKYFHPHHIFSRDHKSIRYDPENHAWLCPDCHRYAHAIGEESFTAELIKIGVRTQEWLDRLIEKKNKIVKFNNVFRIGWKEKLLRLAA